MRMPPPPSNVSTTKDRLFAWIGRHKLASAVIATVALITLLGSIGAATEGTNQAGPAPTATSSMDVIATPSESPQPELAKVPAVMKLSVNQARSRLHAAGFIVLVVAKYSQQAPGTLLAVSADAGSKKKVGSSVSVTVAKSYPTVPNVIGLSQAKATSKLKSAGYNVVVNKQESSQTSGTVISVDPATGTDRLPGRSVTIVVAKAPPPPPPPPPSNCTPGYSPCLPPASDYDCAGGSGNGPAYTVPGVTYRVTGYDPYGLDADNDGYGCE
jgi:resuscitation-promoting factor RpfB